jgi:multidrug efflux pump
MISYLFHIHKTVLLFLIGILIAGAAAYKTIPKESTPEVPIPQVYVMTSLSGISPEDAERLIIRPLESELSSISGITEIQATAREGSASLVLEFDPGFNAEQALDDVREAVDKAKVDLPEDATDPVVQEINTSLFPILSVLVSGDVPERTLNETASRLQDLYESAPGVLEVEITGKRDPVLEIQTSKEALTGYNLQLVDVLNRVRANNQLVSAGSIRSTKGDFKLKIPGLIENTADILSIPIKEVNGRTVSLGDIAEVRQTFKERTSATFFNGSPAISLEIKKKSGANIIETAALIRFLSEGANDYLPEGVKLSFLQDQSEDTTDMLSTLESNVIAAVLLVMIVVLWAMGPTNALLVGISIPGAFLAGVLALMLMGYTMNIVVLFALILVVGLLVDGSIVTVEYADKLLSKGVAPRDAFREASRRMSWPIIASTATTLSVFLPLLFWDQTIGQFMKYLPITIILTLAASLTMALIFIPILGSTISRQRPEVAIEETHSIPKAYDVVLRWATHNPLSVFLLGLTILIGSIGFYTQKGNGVAFFPEIEPEFLQLSVKNTDGLSWAQRVEFMKEIEALLPEGDNIISYYSKTNLNGEAGQIGSIQLELAEWNQRPSADELTEVFRNIYADIPGTEIEISKPANGPTAAKPIELVAYLKPGANARKTVSHLVGIFSSTPGLTDISDNMAKAGVEWRIEIDTQKAAQLGADTTIVGQFVQLMTSGVTISDYRPDYTDESVDIVIRLPEAERSFENLKDLRVPTSKGYVPVSEFISIKPYAATGYIKTVDGKRAIIISSDVSSGFLADERTQALEKLIKESNIDGLDGFEFSGDAEEQQKSMAFLGIAFLVAIALMFLILLTQFNSLMQTFIVMSAIVFSTAGVFLGLIITGRPFMIVMCGIGIIALAGIVVNNNIVFIDAYNELRKKGFTPIDAAIESGRSRYRPVILTSITTILGLLPMAIGMSLNFTEGTTEIGSPATQWWTELATTIAGGMAFATILTLVMTPALLVGAERITSCRFPLYKLFSK